MVSIVEANEPLPPLYKQLNLIMWASMFNVDSKLRMQCNQKTPPKMKGAIQYCASHSLCTTCSGKIYRTRRSVKHCTPHADGAWLNELGWSQ